MTIWAGHYILLTTQGYPLSQRLTTILASFFKLAEGLLNNKLLLPAFKIYNSPGS